MEYICTSDPVHCNCVECAPDYQSVKTRFTHDRNELLKAAAQYKDILRINSCGTMPHEQQGLERLMDRTKLQLIHRISGVQQSEATIHTCGGMGKEAHGRRWLQLMMFDLAFISKGAEDSCLYLLPHSLSATEAPAVTRQQLNYLRTQRSLTTICSGSDHVPMDVGLIAPQQHTSMKESPPEEPKGPEVAKWLIANKPGIQYASPLDNNSEEGQRIITVINFSVMALLTQWMAYAMRFKPDTLEAISSWQGLLPNTQGSLTRDPADKLKVKEDKETVPYPIIHMCLCICKDTKAVLEEQNIKVWIRQVRAIHAPHHTLSCGRGGRSDEDVGEDNVAALLWDIAEANNITPVAPTTDMGQEFHVGFPLETTVGYLAGPGLKVNYNAEATRRRAGPCDWECQREYFACGACRWPDWLADARLCPHS